MFKSFPAFFNLFKSCRIRSKGEAVYSRKFSEVLVFSGFFIIFAANYYKYDSKENFYSADGGTIDGGGLGLVP